MRSWKVYLGATPFGTLLRVKKLVDIVDPFSKSLGAGLAPSPITTVLMVAIASVVLTILTVTCHYKSSTIAIPENIVPVVVCVHHLQNHHLQAAARTVTPLSSVDLLRRDALSVICVKRLLAPLTPAARETTRTTETVELSEPNLNAGVMYAASLYVAHRTIPTAVT